MVSLSWFSGSLSANFQGVWNAFPGDGRKGLCAAKFWKEDGIAEFWSRFPGLATSDFRCVSDLSSRLEQRLSSRSCYGSLGRDCPLSGGKRITVEKMSERGRGIPRWKITKYLGWEYLKFVVRGRGKKVYATRTSSMTLWETMGCFGIPEMVSEEILVPGPGILGGRGRKFMTRSWSQFPDREMRSCTFGSVCWCLQAFTS